MAKSAEKWGLFRAASEILCSVTCASSSFPFAKARAKYTHQRLGTMVDLAYVFFFPADFLFFFFLKVAFTASEIFLLVANRCSSDSTDSRGNFLYKSLEKLPCSTISLWNRRLLRLVRRSDMVHPAREKSRSTSAEDAGIARMMEAKNERIGHTALLPCQKCSRGQSSGPVPIVLLYTVSPDMLLPPAQCTA